MDTRKGIKGRRPFTREAPLGDEELGRLDAWWRAANYLSVGQIYLWATRCSASR